IRDDLVTGVQTCALPIWLASGGAASGAEVAKVARKPGEKLADYIPRLGATPLDFQPGSRWSYSPGAGFDTIGRIVEVLSDQTFRSEERRVGKEMGCGGW